MREFITRIAVVPVGLALLCIFAPALQAKPRVMADEDMDEVCAKGSTGISVDSVTLNQVISFSQQTSFGMVSGSGTISVEVIPNSAGKTTVFSGSPVTVGVPTKSGATPIAISPTEVQVMNGTVQISGSLNVNMQTLPSVQNSLQQNQLVLPPGFNPFSGVQGIGGMR